ncbi:hypothetical protein QBC41DRAFT_323665 [Cercophora samala]|uniref:SnoaL-like domain-containing protein n=1 Tax=Cercophora samala TaxID=330535 RepID=A0AA39ZB13_9PEZI|nr:hypothetical protein QBC41DRAFT_323665 [Cercophora samala]
MPYTVSQFLLDKTNIEEVILKVPLYYDLKSLPALLTEVYAPTLHIDYTSLLGGAPLTIPSHDWVHNYVSPLIEVYSSCQHVTCGIVLPDLPQPSENHSRPATVTVLAQVAGHLVPKPPSGDGNAPKLVHNGGLLEAEVERFDGLEREGRNPWRITRYKVVKGWDNGAGVMDAVKEKRQD